MTLTEQGLRDGLVALSDVARSISNATRRAEQVATEAESELMALRKVKGFVDLTTEDYHARLRAIEDAKPK
jgi:hypothetical protein